MTLKLYPTKIEIHDDEVQQLMATVEMFDEACSDIEIKTVCCPESWPELSDAILEALKMMHKPEKAA
jgi:hypothetical protein